MAAVYLYKRTATQEENDCAVIAIAHAFGIVYERAKRLLVEHGMDARTYRGSNCWQQVCETLGHTPVLARRPCTVADFIAQKRKGHYMLLMYLRPHDRSSYHIVAAADGVLYGDYSPDCVLDCVYELRPKVKRGELR